MNLIKRFTASAETVAIPGLQTMQLPEPHVKSSRMKKRRYQAGSKPRKQRTSVSTRQFLRYQQRLQWSYKPGTIGVSTVSAAIKKEYGAIISRRDRRSTKTGKAFVAFTAGG
jgi:hypothetical protein